MSMSGSAVKTNERPGTRAMLRHAGFSASKARQVLNLIRGLPVAEALDELNRCEREAGRPVGKLLRSAVANAGANDGLPPDELFVAACFADEGPTMRRFRPRARGRATRIRKRSCHITIIVGRLSNEEIAQLVETRKTEVANAIEALGQAQAQIEGQKKEGPPGMERMVALWQLTLDYGSEYYKSEHAWLEKTLKRASKLPPLK